MSTRIAPQGLSPLLIPALLSASVACAWDTTSYRTPNGDLIRLGMSRAEIGMRFERPHDKDIVYRCAGRKCENRVEVWNFYMRDEHVAVTFHADSATRIELIRK